MTDRVKVVSAGPTVNELLAEAAAESYQCKHYAVLGDDAHSVRLRCQRVDGHTSYDLDHWFDILVEHNK